MQIKYDDDFCGWIHANTLALQEKRFNDIDCKHLIEELESMSGSERRAFINCLAQLLLHLLKWQVQPSYRGSSWEISIAKQRLKLADILDTNPSFKSKLIKKNQKKHSRQLFYNARIETGLDSKAFPIECPYTFEQI